MTAPLPTPDPSDLTALLAILEGTMHSTGEEFFHSLVRNLSLATDVPNAFVAEFAQDNTRVRTLAMWCGEAVPNSEWSLAKTPCEFVLDGRLCHFPADVRTFFPDDPASADVESYLGVPLRNSRGDILGHLAVFDSVPMPAEPRLMYTFQIFAARAAAELERIRLERERVRLEREKARLAARNQYFQDEIRAEHNFGEIVGQSPALLAVLQKVARVAATDSTVLIQGETGTGKELIARAIHAASGRRAGPLIKLNCAALPAGLVESELFGHEKGAFTGAVQRKPGRFELADGGTLFLDEVGELPLEMQSKLLRVIQEREFERVGGSAPIAVDIRIVAATNRDLAAMVAARTFREDLFYRLNVFPVELPPLRDRREDIPLLVRFLLGQFSTRIGRPLEGVSAESLRLLSAYDWPGNVRELENVIERAAILNEGSVLEIDPEALGLPSTGGSTGAQSMESVQRAHILAVLTQTDGVIEGPTGAARVLAMHPNTLRSRMKKLGLGRP